MAVAVCVPHGGIVLDTRTQTQQHAHRLFHWVVVHSCRLLVDWLDLGLQEDLFVGLHQRWAVYWHLVHVLQHYHRALSFLEIGKAHAKANRRKPKKRITKRRDTLIPETVAANPTPRMLVIEFRMHMANAFVFVRARWSRGLSSSLFCFTCFTHTHTHTHTRLVPAAHPCAAKSRAGTHGRPSKR